MERKGVREEIERVEKKGERKEREKVERKTGGRKTG